MKKCLSVLLAAALLLCAAPLTGFSVFDFAKTAIAATNYEYELDDDGNATLTNYSGTASSFTVPSSIDGHTVTAIGGAAFAGNDYLCSVVIPDTVTVICNYAFSECASLSQVTLPDSLTDLQAHAFYDCDSLTAINIPKSLETTATEDSWVIPAPFEDCSNLKTVTFERGVTTVVGHLFQNCDGLEEIVIPDTVTVIEGTAFGGCGNLQSVILSENLTRIEESAFAECASLSQVTLPDSLTDLQAHAFYDCDSLTAINIPKSLETTATEDSWVIPAPFEDCSNLKTVTFERGVTTVVGHLFQNCDGLEEIVIPDTVTVIEETAFGGCGNLQSVILSENLTRIEESAFAECASLSQVTLPDSLTDLQAHAFYDCDSLTAINIPKSLETTETEDSWVIPAPFENCSNLKTVTFERGVTTVVGHLFQNCDGLEEIVIPDSVNIIEGSAFGGCENLQSVTFPNQLTKIEDAAFAGCTSLDNVALPNSVTELGYSVFEGCTSLQTITLPTRITTIPSESFSGCISLPIIQLPPYITEIEWYAFYGCSALETITIPNQVETIGSYTFAQCSSLEAVTLSGGSKEITIGTGTFSECSSLTAVNLSVGLKEIGDYAFEKCTALTEIVIPGTVETIGGEAFKECENLTSVVIPSSVATIYQNTFLENESLVDVQIGDYSVTELPDGMFKDCSSLETIVLPKGLQRIGSEAFVNNVALRYVTIPASVTDIESNAFSYPRRMTIYGIPGSYAETFANEKNINFVSIAVPATAVALADGTDTVTVECEKFVHVDLTLSPANATDIVVLECEDPWSGLEIHGLDVRAYSTGDYPMIVTTTSGLTYQFTLHVIDGHEHTYGDWTSYDGVQHYRVCSEDESHTEFAFHTWDAGVVITAATCSEDGEKEFTCTECGATKTETIYATGHSYGSWTRISDTQHQRVCIKNNSHVETANHTWSVGIVTTAPTCLENGTKTCTCTGCKATKTVTVTATGHNYGEWTELNDTQHQRVCANDNTHVETANHTWNDGVVTTSATCTANGVKTYTCETCNATKTETINATGHNYGAWTRLNDIQHRRVCANDNSHVETANHTWNEGVVTTSATCTANGVKTYTCATCNATKTETINATGHSYGAWTRLNDTQHQRVCANNNNHKQTANHTWNDGVVTVPATASAEGELTYTCTACSATKTEPIPKLSETLVLSRVTLSWSSKTYSGSVQKPTVTVKNANGDVLTENEDYTLTWSNANSKIPGDYHVIVAGMGGYTGEVYKYYGITEQAIVASRITLSWTSKAYNCTVQKPTVTVKNAAGYTLTEGSSYTLSWSADSKAPGTYTVTVTGKGYYFDSTYVYYTITEQEIAASRVTLSWSSKAYNGAVQKPTVTVKNAAGGTMTEGTSYTVSYSADSKVPGSYTMTVTAKGYYTGSVTKSYTITKQALDASRMTLSASSFAYTGAARKPAVTVKNAAGYAMTQGSSYTLGWSGSSTAPGTYTVTATGKGYYTGTASKTYTVVPGQAKNLKATIVTADKATLKWDAAPGAQKYMVYYSTTKDGTYTSYGSTANLTYTVSKAGAGSMYYKVRAFVTEDDTKLYGSSSAVARALPGQAKNLKATIVTADKATLKWDAVPGAQKYMVYYSATKDGTYTSYGSTANLTYTVSKAGAGSMYYKVRAFVTEDGTKLYGSSSAVARVLPAQVKNVKATKVSASKATLTWDAVPGAEKYMIYYSTSENGTYTSYGSTANLTYTVSKSGAGTMYYKVRAFVTEDGAKLYGAYSAAAQAK